MRRCRTKLLMFLVVAIFAFLFRVYVISPLLTEILASDENQSRVSENESQRRQLLREIYDEF